MSTVNFTINGASATSEIERGKTLLRYLRDDAGLVGTKDGCTTGDCGSCVVLVDGSPVDSCVHLMRRVDGTSIETIEGLAGGDRLHPIQAAFLDRGAVQCGFCTPGMIMATKALLEENPNPTIEEIRHGLLDNICRCTGYVQIYEAVQQAADWIANPDVFAKWEPTYGPMGTSSVLIDGVRSVRGELAFADDLALPGTLHGKVVWSAHPYARLLSVDVSEARRAPGVHKVITAADVPGLDAHGRTVPDQPVFCHDYVRFTGDPIALVLSANREQADAAAKLVKVEYEELPGLFAPSESLAEGAPQLVSSAPGNICKQLTHEVGDVDSVFASAKNVVAGHFTTQRQDHAYLEPLVCLAEVGADGTVTVHTPTQAPFETREQLVKILDLPREKIRVIATPLGGGFGGKLEIALEGMTAVAAYVTRRPVKITLNREESLQTSVKRHPYEMDYRVAADDDGRLLAVEAVLIADGGPYTGNSPRVIDQACIFSCGPYRVPNLRIHGKAVLTNNPLGGAFRGYGINQAAVSMEQLLDELSRTLGIDPFELRRVNMLVEGDETITGQYLPSSVGAIPTLDACKAAFEEEWPTYDSMARPGYRIGFGIAAGYKNVGAGKGKIDDSGASYTLMPEGRVELRASVVDMGQAIRTTMVQLASESTGIGFGAFDLITQDTALTHPHRSASGQRQTLISGNAVVIAGRSFKRELITLVAGWHGMEPDELDDRRRRGADAVVAVPQGGGSGHPRPGRRAGGRRAGRGSRRRRLRGATNVAAVRSRSQAHRASGGVPQLPDVRLCHPGCDRRGGRSHGTRRPAPRDRRPRRRRGDQSATDPRPVDRQRVDGPGLCPQRELPIGERSPAVEADRLRPARGPDERQRHDRACRDRRGPVPRRAVRGQGDLGDRHRAGHAGDPQRGLRRDGRARLRPPRRPGTSARRHGGVATRRGLSPIGVLHRPLTVRHHRGFARR